MKETIPRIVDCKFEIGRPQNLKQKTDLPNAPIFIEDCKSICLHKKMKP